MSGDLLGSTAPCFPFCNEKMWDAFVPRCSSAFKRSMVTIKLADLVPSHFKHCCAPVPDMKVEVTARQLKRLQKIHACVQDYEHREDSCEKKGEAFLKTQLKRLSCEAAMLEGLRQLVLPRLSQEGATTENITTQGSVVFDKWDTKQFLSSLTELLEATNTQRSIVEVSLQIERITRAERGGSERRKMRNMLKHSSCYT